MTVYILHQGLSQLSFVKYLYKIFVTVIQVQVFCGFNISVQFFAAISTYRFSSVIVLSFGMAKFLLTLVVTDCKCENLRVTNKQVDYNKNILISIVNETRLKNFQKTDRGCFCSRAISLLRGFHLKCCTDCLQCLFCCCTNKWDKWQAILSQNI